MVCDKFKFSSFPWKIHSFLDRVSQKNACSWFFGNNSTLESARKKSRVVFDVIGTKIFQFDLLEAEKIGSKVGNPT